MQSSTVRRERLVTPLNLALMAGLFAIAFVVLKPDITPREELGAAPATEVDDLQLAYLRAQQSVGKSNDSEVVKTILSLARAGRVNEVKSLLADFPDLRVDDSMRFQIDMELAAYESDDSLHASLEKLIGTVQWQNPAVLERAIQLSNILQQPKTSQALFMAWADALDRDGLPIADQKNKPVSIARQQVQVYRQCGDFLASQGEDETARGCYEEALNVLPESDSAIDIHIALLAVVDVGSVAQSDIAEAMVADQQADIEQLSRMASVLLAIERPDLAYRIYARLGMKSDDNSEQWLAEAARWAEAAGKPMDASVFLDSLARSASDEKRNLLNQQIVQLLISAGKNREALRRTSDVLAQNLEDTDNLARGINLALSLGETSQAMSWNAALLEQEPNNIEAIQKQRELALAVTDLPLAMHWAERLVALQAQNVQARQKLARITEWNGQPAAALEHWVWLGTPQRGLTGAERLDALREVVRLAQLTLQPDMGAMALRELTLLERPSDKDVLQLTKLYELDGQPDAAAVALQDIASMHGPNPYVLRTLADLEYRQSDYPQSLAVWDEYVDEFGHTVDTTIARMELLWRDNEMDKAAEEAKRLEGNTLATHASDYQLRLMAEIAWRYRMNWLALMVQPRLDALDIEDQRTLYGRRTLAALQEAGDDEAAMRESIKLWGNTGEPDFALLAMQLAVKVDDKPVLEELSPEEYKSESLHNNPGYWAQIAAVRLREGDSAGANVAYHRALKLDESHVESIAGLLWMAIGGYDEVGLQVLLTTYSELAAQTPTLWQAMAVGYLQLGAAATSLIWFDKLLDQIDTDYGMLLSYADALEYAGRASDSRKVRQYALQQLRPILVDGANDEQDLLLRQYARLAMRYASVENNERLVGYLLNGSTAATAAGDEASGRFWREDVAISWLMATQQQEHARLIMAQLHENRLKAPVWQQVAVALNDEDKAALESIVQASGPMSIGNHVLALRQLGNDRDAYALVQKTLASGAANSERTMALEQYASLRSSRPSYVTGTLLSRSANGLDVSVKGVAMRHTLAGSNIGLSFRASQRQLDSNEFRLEGYEDMSDVSMTLHFGDSSSFGQITTGYTSAENGEVVYGDGSFAMRRGDSLLSAEFAFNEGVSYSPELVIAGARNRATLGYDLDFGKREFLSLRAEMSEINTRLEQEKVASGFGGSVELGVRGSFGSNSWSTSLRAAQLKHDREALLPEELRLSNRSNMDGVLSEESKSLSIVASLSRGGINAEYPQVNSPRYYLNTSLGQNWPGRVVGFQVDAGAGIRVLGGDELSFSVSHDSQPDTRRADEATSIGVNYRYHFQ